MPQRVKRKWRPPLALVIGGTLASVLIMPLIGVGYFRVAGDILGRGETSFLIACMVVVSTTILGVLLWRLVLRPVYALTAYARAMKRGRTDTPLPPHFGTEELSLLGQSVTDMGSTLHNRAAGMKAYADHVTHELKSPLTAIVGAAELLDDDMEPQDRQALAQTIRQAAGRMQQLLGDLRRHAAVGQNSREGTSILSEAAEQISVIEVHVARDGPVPMPQDDLVAVLTQLAQNASGHGAGRITLEISDDMLIVQDDGVGIPDGNRSRVFDPFFTTTRDQGGTGMGLSIVSALVGVHGGQISLEPSEHGARFALVF